MYMYLCDEGLSIEKDCGLRPVYSRQSMQWVEVPDADQNVSPHAPMHVTSLKMSILSNVGMHA